MASSEIQVTDETTHGAYRMAVTGSDRQAELTWRAKGEARVADHTYTPTEARGQGIAQKLVERMVADARDQGFTIVPQCPYVDALFRRHADWADVLADTPS
ncbi:N-acetyltransferase [Erythrobacter arachoides]|uniref:N-acetyltransferase n=1 Tax=Aurantiacibacter arachoides TaxID=1850444 RepID=A0A845A6E6_9SPHN|nr:GNAT family N-acetyltransferase [Aurantiacibacter arachoides]MXO94726.1 N-acetyltransferase [Aurantiacibacter arachoides]GGD61127.1 N-acetyltransferase [Aurantiacibacter arachoides]